MGIRTGDIRKKTFNRQLFGGYKSSEVQQYLQEVAAEQTRLSEQNDRLEEQLRESKETIQRIQGIEAALLKALDQAESQRDEIVSQANKEAEVRVMEGQVAAEGLINTAKQRSEQMLQKVKTDCANRLQRMEDDFDLLEESYQEVEEHVDKLIGQMRAFVEQTNQQLAHLSNLKSQKAVSEKISTAKQLINLRESEEPKGATNPESEPPKASGDKKGPSSEGAQSAPKPKTAPEASKSKNSPNKPKPRTLHESLQLGSKKSDPDNMEDFFRGIDSE